MVVFISGDGRQMERGISSFLLSMAFVDPQDLDSIFHMDHHFQFISSAVVKLRQALELLVEFFLLQRTLRVVRVCILSPISLNLCTLCLCMFPMSLIGTPKSIPSTHKQLKDWTTATRSYIFGQCAEIPETVDQLLQRQYRTKVSSFWLDLPNLGITSVRKRKSWPTNYSCFSCCAFFNESECKKNITQANYFLKTLIFIS